MSNNFHYFHPTDNIASNATWTTPTGTVDTSYPLANIYDFSYAKLANPTKLVGNTGVFLGNFGSAQRIDAVMIWHNFDAGLAVSIQLNATDSWGTPSVTYSPTIPSKRADGYTKKIYKDLTGVSGYSSGGFQFIRVNVSGTNSVPIGLKVMIFSGIRQTEFNIIHPIKWIENRVVVDMMTDGLIPWGYDLGSAARQIQAPMLATASDVLAMQEWFRACGGRAKIGGFVPDPLNPDFYLVRWGNSLNPVAGSLSVSRFEVDQVYPAVSKLLLSFDEITAGDPEWY